MSAPPDISAPPRRGFTLALVGNPNAGKTTLFNALTGLRARTANFPGTTVERKVGRMTLGPRQVVVVDLPGLYSLDGKSPDEKLAATRCRGNWVTPRRTPCWWWWTRRISNGIFFSSARFWN
jgi:GTP-binding protein EngB required for normal cell division